MPLKGTAFETRVESWAIGEGWHPHRARAALVQRPGFVFTRSNDIWKALDFLLLHADKGIWGIQCTTGDGVWDGKHIPKIEALPWPQGMMLDSPGRTQLTPSLRVSIFASWMVKQDKGKARQGVRPYDYQPWLPEGERLVRREDFVLPKYVPKKPRGPRKAKVPVVEPLGVPA